MGLRLSYVIGTVSFLVITSGSTLAGIVIGFGGVNQWFRERRNNQIRTLEGGAQVFWNRLRLAFDDHMGYGMSAKDLRQFVRDASWPDESENDGAKLLRAFAAKVYPPKGSGLRGLATSEPDYEEARLKIRGTLLSWGSRFVGPELCHLITRVDSKNHEETVKLYWFLDESLAKWQGNENPAFEHLARVRDRMRTKPGTTAYWQKRLGVR